MYSTSNALDVQKVVETAVATIVAFGMMVLSTALLGVATTGFLNTM